MTPKTPCEAVLLTGVQRIAKLADRDVLYEINTILQTVDAIEKISSPVMSDKEAIEKLNHIRTSLNHTIAVSILAQSNKPVFL